MGFLWPFGRHMRWQKQLDAYVDGELSAGAAHRFDAHLRECARCGPEVAARRELKRMAAALPELPAPRSFRITPGMLVEAPERAQARGVPVVMRVAQVTAGLAMVAFVGVLVADLSQDGGTNQQRAASDDDAAGSQLGEADAGAGAPAPDGTPFAAESTGSSTVLPELDDDSVSGAGAEPSPSDASAHAEPADRNSITGEQPAESPPQPASGVPGGESDGVASSKGIESEADDGGLDGFVLAEVGLFALAMVAAGTWLVTRRRGS